MTQVIAATFEDGVFRPDKGLELLPQTRVRLTVEPLDQTELTRRAQAWETLQRLWQSSTVNSRGQRLTREQLHERR
jgi:predicted DNA-binding antitoxin AbrB/MazE fold protein